MTFLCSFIGGIEAEITPCSIFIGGIEAEMTFLCSFIGGIEAEITPCSIFIGGIEAEMTPALTFELTVHTNVNATMLNTLIAFNLKFFIFENFDWLALQRNRQNSRVVLFLSKKLY